MGRTDLADEDEVTIQLEKLRVSRFSFEAMIWS